jgi:crossover junction endodeoxyribonuclease RusA
MAQLVLTTTPISVNDLYTGRRFLTKMGKSAKESMAWEIKSKWRNKKLIERELCVEVVFYFKDNRRDIDGSLKALFDCMSGTIWKNDRQIVECHIWKKIDKKNPRIEIDIDDFYLTNP